MMRFHFGTIVGVSRVLFGTVVVTNVVAQFVLAHLGTDDRVSRPRRSASFNAFDRNGEIDCYNGNYINGSCTCFPGWRGDTCGSCHGRTRLDGESGFVTHGFGNYTFNQRCSWLIDGGGRGNVIVLRFHHFETECCWDHVYIFDGDGVDSELVGVFSGLLVSKGRKNGLDKTPEFVTRSGYAFIHFYSDVAYNLTGFNISYSVNSCPRGDSDMNCSGRGACVRGSCTCDAGYRGVACEHQVCPDNCSNHGQCDTERMACSCDPGYKGPDCSQHEDDGVWEWESTGTFLPSGRASHSAVVYGDSLYIVGGEDFKDDFIDSNPQFIVRFDFTGKVWETVHSVKERPAWRYGHTAVMHGDKIYVYGGMQENGDVVNDLWTFDTTSREWEKVQVSIAECSGLCGPVAAVGHTAVTISDLEVMLVFFGHSPVFGYLNTVQEYHFGSDGWSLVETRGALVSGGYGASSVYDPDTGLVYLHGGHMMTSSGIYGSSSTLGSVSDGLLQYNPVLREWTIKRPSGYARYLHTAVLMNGAMIIAGGNVHNDTDTSHGAKCYSGSALIYDPVCDRWSVLDTRPALDQPGGELSRFGHTASVFNGSMYIFGGFSGNLHNNVVKYTPGRCESLKTREDCYAGRVGRTCAWQSNRVGCVAAVNGTPSTAGAVAPLRVRRHRHGRLHGFRNFNAAAGDNPFCPVLDDGGSHWVNLTQVCSSLKNCESCLHTSLGCVHCPRPLMTPTSGAIDSVDTAVSPPGTLEDALEEFKWKLGDATCAHQSCPVMAGAAAKATDTNELEVHDFDDCDPSDWETASLACGSRTSCHSCITRSPLCLWQITKDKGGQCQARKNVPDVPRGSVIPIAPGPALNEMCGVPCHELKNCGNCTKSRCMWCGSLSRCLDSNAYIAAFPYGQCMNWTMHHFECPDVRYVSRWKGHDVGGSSSSGEKGVKNDVCKFLSTCEECQEWPECGWCDNGTGTGLGQCMRGGNAAPYEKTCPRGLWFFTQCPTCQCNGHSTCVNKTDVCESPCQDQTTGDHCERCIEGYYGNPVNGGNCTKCECNGHGTWCDHSSGKCVCTTKGIVGDKCDRCDVQNKYFGNPLNGGTCYYKLTIDYQFTFNMSKPDDRNLTQINFMNMPPQIDVDTEFIISCSENATIDVSFVRKSGEDGAGATEVRIDQDVPCPNAAEGKYEAYFPADKYIFGNPALNTTFRVYVYGFKPPIMIRVAFSQHHRMNLPYFFVTFSLCFLALLASAAVSWKIKQKYDMYRRRQRLFVEMEAMASRPCAQVVLEVEKRSMGECACQVQGVREWQCGARGEAEEEEVVVVDAIEVPDRVVRERGGAAAAAAAAVGDGDVAAKSGLELCHCAISANRRNKGQPSPIALEPCFGGRAAVLTLMVQLPTGGSSPYAPPNADGICVGSALVSLGNPRKASGSEGGGNGVSACGGKNAQGGEVGLLFRATRGFVRPKPPHVLENQVPNSSSGIVGDGVGGAGHVVAVVSDDSYV